MVSILREGDFRQQKQAEIKLETRLAQPIARSFWIQSGLAATASIVSWVCPVPPALRAVPALFGVGFGVSAIVSSNRLLKAAETIAEKEDELYEI